MIEIALGGIYIHLSSKEEIFIEVFKAHHPYTKILPILETALGATIDAFAHDAAQRIITALGNHLDFINLLFIFEKPMDANGE